MDIDRRLHEAGRQWRQSQGPALPAPQLDTPRQKTPSRRWMTGLIPLAASTAVAAIVIGVVVLQAPPASHQMPTGPTSTSSPTSSSTSSPTSSSTSSPTSSPTSSSTSISSPTSSPTKAPTASAKTAITRCSKVPYSSEQQYVSAGPNTSCAFAQNVYHAMASPTTRWDRKTLVSRAFDVYSPTTGGSVKMTCKLGGTIVCRGGKDAVVYLPGSNPGENQYFN